MNKSLGEILFGLTIVVLGTGFLLDSLNIADFSSLLAMWWPMLIVGVGLVSLVSNPRTFVWPLLIMAFGVLLQLRELDIVSFNVWGLIWPVAIIAFGISVLFGSRLKKSQPVGDDQLNLVAAFSGNNSRSISHNFTGGKASAIFGGIELDLTEAKIKDSARLEVFAAFGGVSLRVPEDWRVEVSGLPLFGGWDNKTRAPKSKDAPVLYVTGTCLFGGTDIKN